MYVVHVGGLVHRLKGLAGFKVVEIVVPLMRNSKKLDQRKHFFGAQFASREAFEFIGRCKRCALQWSLEWRNRDRRKGRSLAASLRRAG